MFIASVESSSNKSILISPFITIVIVTLYVSLYIVSGEEAEHIVRPIIGINKIAVNLHEEQRGWLCHC